MDLVLNILAVITLIGVVVLTAMWLLGVDRENTAKISRRWWLIFAGFAAVNAILSASTTTG